MALRGYECLLAGYNEWWKNKNRSVFSLPKDFKDLNDFKVLKKSAEFFLPKGLGLVNN